MINSKGRDSEASWYSVSQLLLFFCTYFATVYVLVWAIFLFWLGHNFFFLPILQMFCTS